MNITRKLTLSLILSSITCVAIEAQAKRNLVIEDYYRVKTVSDPVISPGGLWVAFTVSERIEKDNSTRIQSWLVQTEGSSEPVLVQHGGKDVTDPQWTKDGELQVLAYDNTAWLLDPEDLTKSTFVDEAGEQDLSVSSNRNWKFSVRAVALDKSETDGGLSEFEQRHEKRFKGKAFDWYPFRRDGQSFPLPDWREEALTEIFVTEFGGLGHARQLTNLGLRPQNIQWRPFADQLIFTADESILDELAYPRTDIFMVDLDGVMTRLTNDGFVYNAVGFSPDGQWISYNRSMGTDMIIQSGVRHGGARDLYVRGTEGGLINLTEDWDLDPGNPMWSPDSRYIYFVAGIGGSRHLFRVSPDQGLVEQVTQGFRRINSLDIDDSFQKMTYLVGEFEGPSEVYVADIDGSNEKRLSGVNDQFIAEVDLATRKHERVLYNSYDGTPIEGFLLYPNDYESSRSYPLIVVNHGGPHSASGYGFNFKNSFFAANGYFVFLPNFRSSTGYGDDFKWGTWGAWGSNDGEDVLAGVDHLVQNFPIDPVRVGSTGHSYGGILTNWLITKYQDRFKAAVSGAGASNWTSNYALSDVARTKELEFMGPPWDPQARDIMIKQSAYLNSGGVKAATLFVHGQEDYRVPLEGSIQLYTSLKKQSVPTKLIIYDGMAHGIRGHWNNVHRMINELSWWETYLKPTGKPPIG